MKCKVENCENKIFAKDYCVAHYNRLRRHNSIEKLKAGRKRDLKRQAALSFFPELSERTLQKFWNYIKICDTLDIDEVKIIKNNTRPNGSLSLSISRLENIAKSMFAARIISGAKNKDI